MCNYRISKYVKQNGYNNVILINFIKKKGAGVIENSNEMHDIHNSPLPRWSQTVRVLQQS